MGEGTGGGVDTDVGGAGTDVGGSSQANDVSDFFGGNDPSAFSTPAPDVRPTSMLDKVSSAFSSAVGPAKEGPTTFSGAQDSSMLPSFFNYVPDLQQMQNYFQQFTSSDDRGPSDSDVGAVSVNDNQFNQGLASLSGVPDFVRIGGGTSSPTRNTGPFIPDPPTVNVDPTMSALRRGAPFLMARNAAEEAVQTAVAPPKFMFDYGFGDAGSPQIDDRPRPDPNEIKNKGIIAPLRTAPAGGGDPLLFQDSRIMGMSPGAMGGRAPSYGISPGAMGGLAPDEREPITVTTPTAKPSVIDTLARPDANAEAAKLAALARSGSGAKTQEELNLLQRLGRFLKGVGKSISNFEMNDIFEFLKGDPNFKGPSAAQQALFGVPGPGPFVGGGVPSPSGGGGGGMPAKDPCPPGFRFDPILQQCVPIIEPDPPTDTTTTPTDPTPAAGTSPPVAGGGIADAYPYTLTPPIGAPVGTIPPVRLTT